MKVKVLKDFDYALDGMNATSFKEGEITDKFSDTIARKLMDRKWVGVKASKTDSENPEKIKEEKAKKAQAKLLKKRVKEITEAGAELIENDYCIVDKSDKDSPIVGFSIEDIPSVDDKEWAESIKMIKEIKADNDLLAEMVNNESKKTEDSADTAEDGKNSDTSFDEEDGELGNETEKAK